MKLKMAGRGQAIVARFGRFLLVGCALCIAVPVAAAEPQDAFAYNRLLGRGVNFGNALDAPNEGEWGLTLKEEYFEAIRQAGFDAVRIPIRWSAHAGARAPYTIDEKFFQRVDWAIEQALSRKLVALINLHHYEELFTQPDDHEARFLGIWEQIAARYQKHSDRLYFELLNEPHDKLDAARWNALARAGLGVVRKTNPRRIVIIGPTQWNSIGQIDTLELPADDPWLIATVHYYSPFEFTHQGAEWAPDSARWLGRQWTGTPPEQQAIEKDFDAAARWGKEHHRPIYLGEFGVYHKADMDSRARWTAFVRQSAEEREFSWAYWEFGSGFGVFDIQTNLWREPLLRALVPGK
jgi:endoglucanase